MHGWLVKMMYRILAPRHPRGWVDFHAVRQDDGTLWIHTHGMGRWQLAELEMVGVPDDLSGYAHGIMFDIMGYMKSQKPIKADENFGGTLVSEHQQVMEYCTFRRAPKVEGHQDECLRIVDMGEPVETGFPRQLFAAHLCALGDTGKNMQQQILVLRRSVELYPGDCNQDPQDLAAAGDNPGNYFGWETLGTLLCETGKSDEGLQCLSQAAARWPFAAADFSRHVRELIQKGQAPSPERDPVARFWSELNVVENRRKVMAEAAGDRPV